MAHVTITRSETAGVRASVQRRRPAAATLSRGATAGVNSDLRATEPGFR